MIAQNKRKQALILTVVGAFTLLCAYKLYEDGQQQVAIQRHGSLVRLPIVGRFNGLGTIRSPNKIYVRHQGKDYTLRCTNAYFRRAATLDSLDVRLDTREDRAVLPDQKVTPPAGLLALLTIPGLALTGYGLTLFRRPGRAT